MGAITRVTMVNIKLEQKKAGTKIKELECLVPLQDMITYEF